MKVAFFDRDGTLVKDYPDHLWGSIYNPEIIGGVYSTLRDVLKRKYKIIIITNQYLINEQLITLDQYHQFTFRMIQKFKAHGIDILDVFHCPHKSSDNCNCHKPKPGLIEIAIQKYSDIDLSASFICGDSKCDIDLAAHLNMRGVGINVDSRGYSDNITTIKSIKELNSLI